MNERELMLFGWERGWDAHKAFIESTTPTARAVVVPPAATGGPGLEEMRERTRIEVSTLRAMARDFRDIGMEEAAQLCDEKADSNEEYVQ